MTIASAARLTRQTTRFLTVADVLEHLGGIPAYRVRINPPPGQATEADLLAIDAQKGPICELIDGILVEKDMATYESWLAMVLIYFLQRYLDDHDLGIVLGEGGFLRLFPGQVRAPDVSFISWKRMPHQELPDEPIAALAPDLAVEILTKGNTKAEMDRKLREYFRAGSKLVWYVDPKPRTLRVYTSPRKSTLLTEDDTLDGGQVLPGFSLPIRQWFERARRKPRN
jgi:Uma2 family endonuclease